MRKFLVEVLKDHPTNELAMQWFQYHDLPFDDYDTAVRAGQRVQGMFGYKFRVVEAA